MAEGIRIQPRPDLNWPGDMSVCVVDHSRPRKAPAGVRLEDIIDPCLWCGQRHFAKHYLIHLHAGSAIVSATVWARLQELDDNPFVYANPVPAPPGQSISMLAPGQQPQRPRLIEKVPQPIFTRSR